MTKPRSKPQKTENQGATESAAEPVGPEPTAAEPTAAEPAVVAEVADDGAVLLESWTPLSRSLDVRIGRAAWPSWAVRLFSDERLPHLAHDSGALSRRNAEVLLAWCDAQETDGTLPAQIVVIEAGIGTGLHLRYLLQRFAVVCAERGKDWAARLCVYATDVSVDLLRNVRDRGLFAGDIDVRFALLDVIRPTLLLPLEGDALASAPLELDGTVHLWIANYVLDLLPIDVFRRVRGDDDALVWQAVLVRTWLVDPAQLERYSDRDLAQVHALVAEGSPGATAALAELWTLMQLELRTFDLDNAGHPDLSLLDRVADAIEADLGRGHAALADGTVVHHSGGALAVLRRLEAGLASDGMALIRDVGMSGADEAAVARSLAHYGPTVAAGLSFFELDLAFGGDGATGKTATADATADATAPARLCRPGHDGPRAQASRLLMRTPAATVIAVFDAALDGETLAKAEAQLEAGRQTADVGLAIEAYRAALREEPENWHHLAEAARLALDRGGDARLAAMLAREGLRINAETSGDLWCLLGDAMWGLGDRRAARGAYAQALEIRPTDARAHYGAAFVDTELGRFASALEHIGKSLANDPEGRWRGEALRLLDACLRGQVAAHAAEIARVERRGDR